MLGPATMHRSRVASGSGVTALLLSAGCAPASSPAETTPATPPAAEIVADAAPAASPRLPCPAVADGTCRALETADLVTLAHGGMFMPGFGTSLGGGFDAFGASYGTLRVVQARTADLGTFQTTPLPFTLGGDVTGARAGSVEHLYAVIRKGPGASLHAATLAPRDGGGVTVSTPAPVTLEGTSAVPHWPQATGLADGRVLLAFVESQKAAWFGVSDRSGTRFVVRPAPTEQTEFRGVLLHVGTTKAGAWVLTHQVADASWAFRSYVQISHDEGATWSRPRSVHETDPNVHDAFIVPRLDAGADLYYLRAGDTADLHVHRRALHEDGSLGPEQVVTAPAVGHTEKPQPRRLADGRLGMTFALAKSATDYDLAFAVLAGDAPY